MRRSVVALGCLALALVAAAGAAPQRDALIRPGVGIGKVKLGMSLAQVRAAWGKPQSVMTGRRGRGARTLELQYDFAACDQLDTFIQPRSTTPLIQTNRRECTLGERGGPQTVFVSKTRVPSFLPEDWSKSAYVFEVAIRAPGA